MKKTIRFVSFLVAIIMLLALPVSADESSTYSSLFFGSYDSSIRIISGRNIEIWFDVVGNGAMEELGVSCIELERSSNGTDWSVIRTFRPEDYPQMICYNTGMNYDCIEYMATYGYYYRAYVTFYASDSRGFGEEFEYSETVYITPPSGFIPRSA